MRIRWTDMLQVGGWMVVIVAILAVGPSITGVIGSATAGETPQIAALPKLDEVNEELAKLGSMLFFDPRLSGDGAISCATCHRPENGWADGKPLSSAYPGSEYFRNSKTVLNIAHARYLYWDGRLTAKDLETQVRDSITETHFMNMDGRLMLERLKQVPAYDQLFKQLLGGEPSFGRTLKAIAAFERTLVSRNVPFDQGKMSESAQRGLQLFTGKARCVQCHNGAYFSDGEPHNLGVPENPAIVQEPLRHITLRSFAKFMGVPGFERLRDDIGFMVVSKDPADRGAFVTPTLRELRDTAPYMHNGMFKTLDEVVEFYNAGGGDVENKDLLVQRLRLKSNEKKDLIAFLLALSGDPIKIEVPELPEYEAIENWRETLN